MNRCLLTIAIPTWNRCDLLKDLLNSIAADVVGIDGQIELWISNNASTDDTEKMLERFRIVSKIPVFYHKHNNNIGGNSNIAFAATLGQGNWVWVMGDDEIIPAGALRSILSYLKTDIDYLILNHSVFDHKMESVRIKRWVKLKADKSMIGKDEAMRTLGPMPTFISAVVARRGILDSLSGDLITRYAPMGFNQLYAFYAGLDSNSKGVLTADVLLFVRGNNSGADYNWNHFFITGLGVIFQDLVRYEHYSRKDVATALGSVIKRYHIRRVLNEIAEGRSVREMRVLAYPYYSGLWLYWILILPATFLPVWLMRKLKKYKVSMR